jgi:hypothetical protein
MALGSLVKTLQNTMRKDAGINGDAQRIERRNERDDPRIIALKD